MIINQWKRSPDDAFTVMEVPSKRATDILVMIGGKVVGYKYKPMFVGEWSIVHLPDVLIERAFTVLRELKSKGVDFDKE